MLTSNLDTVSWLRFHNFYEWEMPAEKYDSGADGRATFCRLEAPRLGNYPEIS